MPNIWEVLQASIIEQSLSLEHYQQLSEWEVRDRSRVETFGINSANLQDSIHQKLGWLRSLIPILPEFPLPQGQLEQLLPWLWTLWLPLAIDIATRKQALNRPIVQGLLGGQGTGKTTLAKILKLILQQHGYKTIGISLDDLYKTRRDRQLLRQQDPRLIWRGPPSTHDVDLGITVLEQLRQPMHGQEIAIPRFDKSLWAGEGDRIASELVCNVDIVLFEGWFVGVHPIDAEAFATAPPPIITAADRQFACDMNHQLQAYLPLWNLLDSLIVLLPSDYRLSQQWRQQAEHQMIATGKSGMDDEQINQFVAYFWKALHPELFLPPLLANLDGSSLIIEIQSDRSPRSIYRPVRAGDRT